MSEVLHVQTHATCRASIDEKIRAVEERITRDEDVTEKRLDGHALDIKTVNSMMARLIVLQENSDKRLAEIELEKADRIAAMEARKPFWESPVGAWVIKAAVIGMLLIIGAAIGINSLDAIKAIPVP